MKTKMMRLLLAALMMGLPMFQSEMYAGNIRVQTKKVNDNRKDEHKHLAPDFFKSEPYSYVGYYNQMSLWNY